MRVRLRRERRFGDTSLPRRHAPALPYKLGNCGHRHVISSRNVYGAPPTAEAGIHSSLHIVPK